MKPTLSFGAAAVCASAVPAGIMASSSGSAIVAPTPRSTVRRDRCFFVTNIVTLLLPRVIVGWRRRAEPERLAQSDAGQDRRETVVLPLRVAHDAPHGRHVVVLDAAAERMNHELLGQGLHELRRVREQRFT